MEQAASPPWRAFTVLKVLTIACETIIESAGAGVPIARVFGFARDGVVEARPVVSPG